MVSVGFRVPSAGSCLPLRISRYTECSWARRSPRHLEGRRTPLTLDQSRPSGVPQLRAVESSVAECSASTCPPMAQIQQPFLVIQASPARKKSEGRQPLPYRGPSGRDSTRADLCLLGMKNAPSRRSTSGPSNVPPPEATARAPGRAVGEDGFAPCRLPS